MPEELKREYNEIKSETKTPISQFSALVLIGALVTFGIYANKKSEKKELEYLANPAVDDVYEYKTESGSYSTLKVVNVTTDSVFVPPIIMNPTK